jgi:transposase
VFSLIWRESFAHMTDTICDTKLGCGRVEIRTGVGRRRRWTAQEKARIVAETLHAGVAVAEIARRHDMSSQPLFNWIRAAKKGRLAVPPDEGAMFVPIVAAAPEMRKAPNAAALAAIEIRIKDFVVRAVPGVDMRLLVDVLRAVKAAA